MGLDNGTGRTSVIDATRRRHLPTTWVVSTRQDRLFQEDCRKKCHESVICHGGEDEISFHTIYPKTFLPQSMYMSKRSAWGPGPDYQKGRVRNFLRPLWPDSLKHIRLPKTNKQIFLIKVYYY